jgi:hypothetical protein
MTPLWYLARPLIEYLTQKNPDKKYLNHDDKKWLEVFA